MQAIDAYRGDGPLRNWLFRIGRNTAFNYRKSAFWRKVALVGLFPAASGSPSAENAWKKSLSDARDMGVINSRGSS